MKVNLPRGKITVYLAKSIEAKIENPSHLISSLRFQKSTPNMKESILLPVLALVSWTMVMLVWLVTTRVPAMQKVGLHKFKTKRDTEELLPKKGVQSLLFSTW